MSIYMIRLTNPVKGILNTQFGQKITKRLAGWLMKKGLTPKRWRPGGDNSGARPRLRTAKSWK